LARTPHALAVITTTQSPWRGRFLHDAEMTILRASSPAVIRDAEQFSPTMVMKLPVSDSRFADMEAQRL